MTDKPAAPARRPLWVRIILWGIPTRAHAWAYVWLCFLLATTCLLYSFWNPRFAWGAVLLLGVFGYWSAIRWVDKHGKWQ
jgi:hypothetical protein